MTPYLEEKEKVLSELGSSTDGLSEDEAEARLKKYGANKLAEPKKESVVRRFLAQLADPMIIILLAAAVFSAITAVTNGESFADVFIILFVVVVNAALSVMQESKAEQAIEALRSMASQTTRVLRNGILSVVRSETLVPGDLVCLEAGDAVPADCRIVECASLKAEEAALTGESVAVDKTDAALKGDKISLGDRKNMLYTGSSVAYGRAKAVVCSTGMDTEIGRIADVISKAQQEQTPLQKKLAELSKVLTKLVLAICVVMFVVGVIRAGSFTKDVLLDTFMVAVSLAVAAIPEGLVAVVTIVLSVGVTKMARRSAIIRKMTAVETLGCTQVICSDKTGTLTLNKMTVADTYGPDTALLARAMALCSDAEFDLETRSAVGEPTECALVNFAASVGLEKPEIKKEFPRVGEAPFDSMRKRMSTVHRTPEGFVQFTKGAPDEVLARCTRVLTPDGVKPLGEAEKKEISEANRSMADRALRVLAAAYRDHDDLPASFEPDELENDMVFVGLCGMIDPVRPEVRDAVRTCREAGIRTVMITGDHINTAVAIGRQLGIVTDPSQAIRGAQLDDMSDDELDKAVERFSVYARVQPEHKVRIVSAWKRKGMITAMTGDGVNDAPSIKVADIGVGMGITGTDVTKNVADMILADDNFATIVAAVGEGRRIYQNIRKAIQFLLSSNLSEVIGIFFATVMGFTLLKPVHMLWINLITDSLPALALGMEKGEPDSMKKPPRDPKKGIFSDGVGVDIAYQGVFVALLTLAAYFIGHWLQYNSFALTNSSHGMTMAFLTMSMAEIFQAFNMRSQKRSIFTLGTSNGFLWGSSAVAFVLTASVIFVPGLASVFDFETIGLKEFAIAFSLALAIIPLVELVKLVKRAANKKKER